jgi:ubiquinone/menaquinone biosynthesis C-methylase UbiE
MSDLDFENYDGLDLGCGDNKKEGFLGLDKFDVSDADIIHDLDEFPWPLPDSTFEEVRAIAIFEHVDNPKKFMEEIHRVSRDGAKVVIRAPHKSSQNWTDFTHKRLVGYRTFDIFFSEDGKWRENRTKAKYRTKNVDFIFRDYPLSKLAKRFAQWKPIFFEETGLSRIFPCYNIEFELEVVK